MIQVLENTMEMHLRKLSELSNEKCKPTGSSNIFHHLKGRGVEISPWTVLADRVIATSQTKIMGFKQEWQEGKKRLQETMQISS